MRINPVLLLLITHINPTYTSITKILQTPEPYVNDLRQCLEEILKNYDTHLITVVILDDAEDYLDYRFTAIRRYIKSVDMLYEFDFIERLVVIFLEKLHDVSEVLNMLSYRDSTEFVVVSNSVSTLWDMEKFFSVFSRKLIINVVLILRGTKGILVYKYEPFTVDKCYGNTPKLVGVLKYGRSEVLFYETVKTKVNYEGCHLTLSYMDFPPWVIWLNVSGRVVLDGIEGRAMNIISIRLNYTPSYRSRYESDWGSFQPPTGLLGDLHTGASEIGFGTLFSFAERYRYLDVAVPHNVDECVAWVVPKGHGIRTPRWLIMFIYEYDPFVWLAIMFIFVFSYSIFKTVTNLTSNEVYIYRPGFYTFSGFIGQHITIPNVYHVRIYIIFWIWYSFIITSAYQSAMSSRLTAPSPPPDIKTLQQLADSDLHLTGPFNAKKVSQMIAEYDDGVAKKQIANRFEVHDYRVKEVLTRMVTKRDVAFLRHERTFNYVSLQTETLRGKTHVVDECTYQYYPWILLRKHSPMTKYVNQVISSLNEGGILQKWKNDIAPGTDEDSDTTTEVQLEHLKGVFFLWGTGCVVSVFVFLWEKCNTLGDKNRKNMTNNSILS